MYVYIPIRRQRRLNNIISPVSKRSNKLFDIIHTCTHTYMHIYIHTHTHIVTVLPIECFIIIVAIITIRRRSHSLLLLPLHTLPAFIYSYTHSLLICYSQSISYHHSSNLIQTKRTTILEYVCTYVCM